mmetsp:Transcript_38/g.144  ORF Transcript_38/g.144 Transcript_38/m.144 type:complete len:266 (-) Transcript_38:508-1305(-)
MGRVRLIPGIVKLCTACRSPPGYSFDSPSLPPPPHDRHAIDPDQLVSYAVRVPVLIHRPPALVEAEVIVDDAEAADGQLRVAVDERVAGGGVQVAIEAEQGQLVEGGTGQGGREEAGQEADLIVQQPETRKVRLHVSERAAQARPCLGAQVVGVRQEEDEGADRVVAHVLLVHREGALQPHQPAVQPAVGGQRQPGREPAHPEIERTDERHAEGRGRGRLVGEGVAAEDGTLRVAVRSQRGPHEDARTALSAPGLEQVAPDALGH